MIAKKFFGLLLLMFVLCLFPSCHETENEWPPYAGFEWHAPHNGDSICLKLETNEIVTLSLVSEHQPLSTRNYRTHRGKFLFDSCLEMRFAEVSYNLEYALFTPTFEMVVYGDSFNALCDTALMEWSLPFTLVTEALPR